MTELRSAEGFTALLALKGVGPKTALGLSERFSTREEMEAAPLASFKGAANETIARRLGAEPTWFGSALDGARGALANARAIGAAVTTVHDASYPARLAEVSDQPLVLTHFGPASAASRCVAFLGPRDPSDVGRTVATRIAEFLASSGWSLAAGLERGADRIAHLACAKHGVPSVAVLASGIDWYRSDDHAEAAEGVHENGGLIVTEHPMGLEQDPTRVIRSHRIRSGLSAGLVVAGCELSGVEMHAIRYALMQGRPLFVPVPFARLAAEPEGSGLEALVTLTGPELAERTGARADFRSFLEENFPDRPVATPIGSREDYAAVLSSLEEALQPQAAPEASPAP